jgi:hypothetical protein
MSEPKTIIPRDISDEQALAELRAYVTANPGVDASAAAEALRLPIRRTFALADRLIAEGTLEV